MWGQDTQPRTAGLNTLTYHFAWPMGFISAAAALGDGGWGEGGGDMVSGLGSLGQL